MIFLELEIGACQERYVRTLAEDLSFYRGCQGIYHNESSAGSACSRCLLKHTFNISPSKQYIPRGRKMIGLDITVVCTAVRQI